MIEHPSVRSSFFTRFLLLTAFLGNIYLALMALAHTFHFHALDLYLRWYGFKASGPFNLLLLAGACITAWGTLRVRKNGLAGFKIYFAGKAISLLAFIILTIVEYKLSDLPYPGLLIPVLVAVESIYPILLYLSLRKSKARA
jgi:hypothetical protein